MEAFVQNSLVWIPHILQRVALTLLLYYFSLLRINSLITQAKADSVNTVGV